MAAFSKIASLANSGSAQIILSGVETLYEGLHDIRSPLFNFARQMLLGPFDRHATGESVAYPLKQLEIELVEEEAIIDSVWNFTSGHPNLIQRLCLQLVDSLAEHELRRITVNDVNAVGNSIEFQEDFLDTYWSLATPLERIISLLMADDGSLRTVRALSQALAERCDIHPKLQEIDQALRRLVDLRSILRRTSNGYEFAVEAFPNVVTKAVSLDDLIVVLGGQYEETAQANSMARRVDQ